MAHLRINDSIGCGKTFFPGQLFVFGNVTLYADSTGYLGLIENFAPGQTIRFGNLEYAADACSELAFSGWVSDQSRELTDAIILISDSISDQDHGADHTSDLASSPEPNTGSSDQTSSLANEIPETMLDGTSGKLRLSLTLSQDMGEADKELLNEMLDRIHSLAISDGRTSVYDQICEKSGVAGIFNPASTHLVATIEDLTDVLDYASEEAADMDEDVGAMSETTSPTAATHTGTWAATSTYDVYMVDTPKDGGGSKKPPKRQHRGRHNGGTGNGGTSDGDIINSVIADNNATKDGAGNQNTGNDVGAGKINGDNMVNGDEDDPEDDNYYPESEEDRTLGPNEYDVIEEPLEAPQLEAFRRWLASTAQSIKQKSQRLKSEQDELNDRWVKLLWAEQELEDKLEKTGVNRSYPRRNLLLELEEEAEDSVLSKREWAKKTDRPPRGRDKLAGGYKNLPEATRHRGGVDPPRPSKKYDLREKLPLRPEAPPRSIYKSRERPPAGQAGYLAWLAKNGDLRDYTHDVKRDHIRRLSRYRQDLRSCSPPVLHRRGHAA